MWERKTHFIDKGHAAYNLVLHDPETGDEHHVRVYAGHTCPTCGRATPMAGVDEIDLRTLEKEELANLEKTGQMLAAMAKKHGVPVRRANKK